MDKENQITIALIDDHQGLRISLQNFLEYSNFKVVLQAANGQEAIEGLQMQEVLPQICILDISMPVTVSYTHLRAHETRIGISDYVLGV